eukprot:7450144-Pyramimonas_sp.AAC.1
MAVLGLQLQALLEVLRTRAPLTQRCLQLPQVTPPPTSATTQSSTTTVCRSSGAQTPSKTSRRRSTRCRSRGKSAAPSLNDASTDSDHAAPCMDRHKKLGRMIPRVT